MTQTIGLIEIETDEAFSLRSLSADDETLDGLFARLVCDSEPTTELELLSCADVRTPQLTADLDALSADLSATARDVIARIFLSLGCR